MDSVPQSGYKRALQTARHSFLKFINMISNIALLIAVLACFVKAQVVITQPTPTESLWNILFRISTQTNELSIFRQQAEQFTELVNVLVGNAVQYQGQPVSQQLTVFVPTNQAFNRLPEQVKNQLLYPRQPLGLLGGRLDPAIEAASRQILLSLLSYHVVNESVNLEMMGQQSQTANKNMVPTLLFPFTATISQCPSGSGGAPIAGDLNMTAIMNSAQSPRVNVVNGTFINDAAIVAGFRGSNGYLYLIDQVISPLWNVNVSLTPPPNRAVVPC